MLYRQLCAAMLCLRMQEQVCASVGSVDQIGVARRPARISYQQMMCVCVLFARGNNGCYFSQLSFLERERNDRKREERKAPVWEPMLI